MTVTAPDHRYTITNPAVAFSGTAPATTDYPGATLTYAVSSIGHVLNGALVLNADGTFVFTPDNTAPGFPARWLASGSNVYYLATEQLPGGGTGATEKGMLIFAPPPATLTAPDYRFTITNPAVPFSGSSPASTSIAGATLTYNHVTVGIGSGDIVLNADGTFVFTPYAGFAANIITWGAAVYYIATEHLSGGGTGLTNRGLIVFDAPATITAPAPDPDFPLTGVSKVLLPSAELQFLDANGHPYAGGSLETLVPSTDTPKDTWSDPAGASLNVNPIILDSAGRCIVFGDGAYRTILRDAAGNLIWDKPSFTYVSAAMLPVVGAPTIAAAVVLLGIADTIATAVAGEATLRAAADTAEAATRAAQVAALSAEDVVLAAAIAAETAARIAAIGGLPGPATVDVLLRRGTTVSAGDGTVSITFAPAFPLYCMTFGLDLTTFDLTGGFQLVGETISASTVTFTFTLADGTTPRATQTFNWWATGY